MDVADIPINFRKEGVLNSYPVRSVKETFLCTRCFIPILVHLGIHIFLLRVYPGLNHGWTSCDLLSKFVNGNYVGVHTLLSTHTIPIETVTLCR